jgi:iron(III) transport system permease protein
MTRAGRIKPVPIFGYGILAAALGVFFVYPVVMVIIGAFRTSSPGFPGNWSTDGFVAAYTDSTTYVLLGHSVGYAAAVTIISTIGSVFFAWVVTQTNTPWRRAVTPIMVMLLALPFLFFALSWTMLGNSRTGLLNQLIRLVFPGNDGPIDIRSWIGIIFVSVLKVTAIGYLLMLGIFRSLDPALREASIMSGVGRFRTFIRIELPLLMPVLLSLGLLGFVAGIESFDVPLIIGSPVGIEVFSTQIYNALNGNVTPDYAYAGALSVLVIVMVAILAAIMWRYLSRRDFAIISGKGQRTDAADIGRWKYLCTAAIVIYAIVALAFPLFQLVFGSLQPVFGVVTSNFTLEHYRNDLDQPVAVQALKNTLFVAIVGGFISVALAAIIAYTVQRTKSRARWLLEGVTWLPWAVPGVVLSLGMLWAYLSVPVLRTLFATRWFVLIGLVVVVTPIAVRLDNAAIAQVQPQLEESARVHGANAYRAAIGIVLRLVLPSLTASWLICGVTIAGNLAVPAMLAGPDSGTVPSVVLQLTDSGDSADAAALFTLMIGAMIVLLVVGLILRSVGGRLTRQRSRPTATSTDRHQVQDQQQDPTRGQVPALSGTLTEGH